MKSLIQMMIQRGVLHFPTVLYSLMQHQDSFLVLFERLAETWLGTLNTCHAFLLTVFHHVAVYGLESLSYVNDAFLPHALKIGA